MERNRVMGKEETSRTRRGESSRKGGRHSRNRVTILEGFRYPSSHTIFPYIHVDDCTYSTSLGLIDPVKSKFFSSSQALSHTSWLKSTSSPQLHTPGSTDPYCEPHVARRFTTCIASRPRWVHSPRTPFARSTSGGTYPSWRECCLRSRIRSVFRY